MSRVVVVLFIVLILVEILTLTSFGFSSGKASVGSFAALVFTCLAFYQYDEYWRNREQENQWKPRIRKAKRAY